MSATGAVADAAADVDRFAPSATPLYVRFADVDMVGVVHHAAYVHWFEQIRFNFLWKVMGIEWDTLRRGGFAFPLTECTLKYLRAIEFEDRLTGYARLQIHQKAMVTFHYAICSAGEPRIRHALGTTTHCYVQRDRRLLLRPPLVIQQGFETVLARHPDGLLPPDPAGAHALSRP
jgi:acyl-CoA thioester hydrolase